MSHRNDSLFMLVLAAVAAPGCSAHCSRLGCQNEQRLVFSVPRDTENAIAAELCREDACASASFSVSALQTDGNLLVSVDYDGPSTTLPTALICLGTAGDTSLRCSVTWTIATVAGYEAGDVLSVRLTSGDEELSFRSGRTQASHPLPSPDGDECGEPCEYATVDLSE